MQPEFWTTGFRELKLAFKANLDYAAFERAAAEGLNIRQCMAAAGYAETTCSLGYTKMNRQCKAIWDGKRTRDGGFKADVIPDPTPSVGLSPASGSIPTIAELEAYGATLDDPAQWDRIIKGAIGRELETRKPRADFVKMLFVLRSTPIGNREGEGPLRMDEGLLRAVVELGGRLIDHIAAPTCSGACACPDCHAGQAKVISAVPAPEASSLPELPASTSQAVAPAAGGNH